MYRKVEIKEVTHDLDNVKLCYVGPIERTYSDYTPETKAFMKTEEFARIKAEHDQRVEKELKDYSLPFQPNHIGLSYIATH